MAAIGKKYREMYGALDNPLLVQPPYLVLLSPLSASFAAAAALHLQTLGNLLNLECTYVPGLGNAEDLSGGQGEQLGRVDADVGFIKRQRCGPILYRSTPL